MKTILLIIPNMDFGGAQRSFSKLSLSLGKKYNVVNVVFNDTVGIAYPLSGTVISLDVEGGGNPLTKISNFITRVRKLKKIKQECKADVAISFLEGADYINVLSKGKERVVVSIRGSKHSDETIKGFIGFLRQKLLIPYLYKKVDLITCVNRGIAEELNRYYGLSSVSKKIIYNYYDLEAIAVSASEKIPVEFSGVETKPFLVFSGRLAIEKGIDKLIMVYNALASKKRYRFVIVGSGPMQQELFDLCDRLGIRYYTWTSPDLCRIEEADIIFVGEQSNPHKFVSKATLFLMASSSEGFPNALAEAMACNTPVISTDCPWGPREILSETETSSLPEFASYGILMPVVNVKHEALEESLATWVSTLDQILADQNILDAYAKKGALRLKKFSLEKNTQDWEAVVATA